MESKKKRQNRAQQTEETRTKIIQAALDEFSRHGYGGANIRSIAARAGVNHGLIKYHFNGKEMLWRKSVEYMFRRSHEEISIDQEVTTLEGVKELIRRYTRYCARHPEHARIMIQASMHDREILQWALEQHLLPNRDRLVEAIRKEQAGGIWPQVSEVSLIYIIVSACQLIFALAAEANILYGVNVQDDAFVDQHAEAIITLFFDHIVKGPAALAAGPSA